MQYSQFFLVFSSVFLFEIVKLDVLKFFGRLDGKGINVFEIVHRQIRFHIFQVSIISSLVHNQCGTFRLHNQCSTFRLHNQCSTFRLQIKYQLKIMLGKPRIHCYKLDYVILSEYSFMNRLRALTASQIVVFERTFSSAITHSCHIAEYDAHIATLLSFARIRC